MLHPYSFTTQHQYNMIWQSNSHWNCFCLPPMLRFPRFENSSPFGHKKMVPAPSPNLRRASFEMAKPTATVTTPPTSLGARVAVYGASIFDPTPSSPLWIWGFPSMGVPPNGWFVSGKIPLKWMIWGYPYFGKPPYGFHLRYRSPFHLQTAILRAWTNWRRESFATPRFSFEEVILCYTCESYAAEMRSNCM